MKFGSWSIIVVVIISGVLLLWWDEALDPQVQVWLDYNERSVAAHDNGYFTLMGLFAAPADDPHEVGRKRVQAYELALAATPEAGHLEYEDYPSSLRLRAGEEFQFLCQVEKWACVSRILEQAGTVVAVTEQHRVLLDRYRSLYDFPAFHSTATPGIDEPVVPYHLLDSLNRLLGVRLSLEFHFGSRLKAVEDLIRDMQFLRRLLADSDQLRMKLLVLEMLVRDLHLLAQLFDSHLYLHEYLPNLDDILVDLSAAESTVSACVRREFEVLVNLMLTLESTSPLNLDARLPAWVMKLLFKPNATVNRLLENYQLIDELTALPPSELARKLSQLPEQSRFAAVKTTKSLLNPIGTVLREVAAPDFIQYLPLFSDATGLLRLVRLKRLLRARDVSAHEVEKVLARHSATAGSPYEPLPMGWNQRNQVIFFQGLSQHRHYQTLALYF